MWEVFLESPMIIRLATKNLFLLPIFQSQTNIPDWVFINCKIDNTNHSLVITNYISGSNTKRESGRKVQIENINAAKVCSEM